MQIDISIDGNYYYTDFFHELMAYEYWDNSPTSVFANVSALVQAVRAVVE